MSNVDHGVRTLRLGETFGRYGIEELLGEGGMGRVYRALDTKLQRKVALKVLRVDKEGDPERWRDLAARMTREARAAAALDHPNAVSIFDVGEVDGAPFIAMELVLGRSLRAYVGDAHVPWARKLRWLVDVGAALAAAHEAGLVHRDVKPENVVVRDDGRVKVLDFGIARRARGPEEPPSSGGARTGKGVILGTVNYMSPEQIGAGAIDGRSDQFAWAVTAYELLTGATPWPAKLDALATAGAILTLAAPPIETLLPDLPAPVASAVMRALAKAPADRFATMNELLAIVEPFAAPPVPSASSRASLPAPAPSDPTVDPHAATIEHKPPTDRSMSVDSTPSPKWPHARTWRARAIAATAGGGLVVAGVVGVLAHRAGWWAATSSKATAAASASGATVPPAQAARLPAVLVLGVENRTPDPVFEPTVEYVIDVAFRRSPVEEIFAGSSLRYLAAELEADKLDETVGRKLLARDGGKVVTVRAAVAAKGAGYVLSIEARDAATGAPMVGRAVDAPDLSAVLPALGTLVWTVRASLGEALPSDPKLVEETGASLSFEADHEAALGTASHAAGRDLESVTHLERAVTLDPDFTRAHADLGIDLWNQGRWTEAADHLTQAIKGAERMGDYDRLRLLGDYYSLSGEYDRAIAAFRQLLSRWPKDRPAETNLCHAYVNAGSTEAALAACRTAAADHPRAGAARVNEVCALLLAEDYEAVDRAADKLVADFPRPHWQTYLYRGLADALQGRREHALEAYDKLAAANAGAATSALADLAFYEGRFADAEALLSKGIAADEDAKDADGAAHKWVVLAQLRVRRGDEAGAAGAAARAASSPLPAVAYAAAQAYLDAGQPKKAQALAARLSESLSADARRFAKLLEAETLRASGKPRDAVDVYERISKESDYWLTHFLLARAYLDLRAFAEAKAELMTCLARRGAGAQVFLDDEPSLRYLPPAYYWLARAQERLGSPQAVEAYKTFLALEPNARADPLVEDARRRVAGR